MSKQKRKILRQGFIKSLPILCSYIFLGAAYGMMMENAGFSCMYSLLASVTVYTGAFQFMLITFLSSGASIATIAISALLMNSRQFFYGLTFLEEFRQMGKRKWYMIPTLTDETYAVNCRNIRTRKKSMESCFWLPCSVIATGQLVRCSAECSGRLFRST